MTMHNKQRTSSGMLTDIFNNLQAATRYDASSMQANINTDEDNPHAELQESKQRIQRKMDAINNHVSLLPSRLHQTRSIIAWQRYDGEVQALRPAEQRIRINGILQHTNHLNLTEDEKLLFATFTRLLNELKSEYTDAYINMQIVKPAVETINSSTIPMKSEKEIIREQIARLTIERDQALKDNDKNYAASTNKLIVNCEARLFHKPMKDAGIDKQKKDTAMFYFNAVSGNM
jgi:hypothetical protein